MTLSLRHTCLFIVIAGISLLAYQYYQYAHNLKLDLVLTASATVIVLLVTGLLQEYYTLLAFLTLMVIAKVVSAQVAFSGFTTPAFWLTCASVILGMATKETGLAGSFAAILSRHFHKNYLSMLVGVACFGSALAVAMPSSMGRMFILLPIFTAFAQQNGFKPGSKGHTGICLCGALASNFIGFTILPANLPNLILMGAASANYNINLHYANYFVLQFPIIGLVKILALIALCYLFFYQTPQRQPQANKSPSLSFQAKQLLVILVLLTAAWLSDGITHLAPAWPALAAALICLLPKVGLLSHQDTMAKVNPSPLFFIAGLIGFSAVLNTTGLAHQLGQALFSVMPLHPHHSFLNLYLATLTAIATSLFTTIPGAPAILTPMAQQFSHLTGLPLHTVLMTQVVGCATLVFPFQAPPALIAMRLGNISMNAMLKVTLALTFITLIALVPLQWLWWHILGVLG